MFNLNFKTSFFRESCVLEYSELDFRPLLKCNNHLLNTLSIEIITFLKSRSFYKWWSIALDVKLVLTPPFKIKELVFFQINLVEFWNLGNVYKLTNNFYEITLFFHFYFILNFFEKSKNVEISFESAVNKFWFWVVRYLYDTSLELF